MNKFSIYFSIILLGITAIVTQVVLVREFIVTFSGNELSIGIILANLLIIEAGGSYFAGRWALKNNSPYFYYTILQSFLALILPLVIYLSRVVPTILDIVPGEELDIITIFYTSFLLLIPIGFIFGAQFSIGCMLLASLQKRTASLVGRVYAYEAIGSVIGGVIATYLCLQLLNAMQTAFLLSFLNLISMSLLLYFNPYASDDHLKSKLLFPKIINTLLMLVLFGTAISGGVHQLQQDSIQKKWPDFNIVSYKNSVFGNTTLLEQFEQWHLLSNGVSIATLPTPDINQTEDLIHFPFSFHLDPKDIFLLGGGLSGLLGEILKYQIDSIDYVELDPLHIKTISEFAPDSITSKLKSNRINTHFVDGRYFLRTTNKQYDIIILNIPDPSTLILNRFFTTEFYKICQTHLRKNGLLVFHLPGSSSYMNTPLIKLINSILNSVHQSFRYQRILPFEQTIVIASNNKLIHDTNPEILLSRLDKRQIQTKLFSDLYLKYKLDSTRVVRFNDDRKKIKSSRLNRDLEPAALYYDLLFWNSSLSAKIGSIYGWFEVLTIYHLLLFTILIFLIIFYFQWKGKFPSQFSVIISIFTTGMAGMGLTMMLLLTFQAYYGYIYYWIGLLISAFMAGLASGGFWGSHYVKKDNDHYFTFFKTEGFISLYLFFISICLLSAQQIMKMDILYAFFPFLVLILTFICGGLAGTQFPVATRLYMKDNDHFTQTVGALYASDLTGAWLGGIVITLILIPIIGIVETAFILFILKSGSTAIYRFSRS